MAAAPLSLPLTPIGRLTPMPILERLDSDDFEKVLFLRDGPSGLRAIVAIHDTTLGPALGGVRMRPYATEEEALTDVLRLARGMTYKASIAGVELGGGKSVVLGDPATDKSEALLRAFGRFVDGMGGEYVVGQDIGTGSDDMAVIAGVTDHVSCVAESAGGAGDPSYVTAYGVTCGIRAVLETATGSCELEGRRIAVQGLGHVGSSVARYCREAGAAVTVADVDGERVRRAVEEIGAEAVEPDAIYDVECDVFSPCAIGAVLNDDTIPRLRCAAVAGGANNQLAEPRHAGALSDRGILYAPDYLVNSGGLIRCSEEACGAPTDDERIFGVVEQIHDQVLAVIDAAEERGITTAEAADRLAEERIASVREAGEAWNPLRNA